MCNKQRNDFTKLNNPRMEGHVLTQVVLCEVCPHGRPIIHTHPPFSRWDAGQLCCHVSSALPSTDCQPLRLLADELKAEVVLASRKNSANNPATSLITFLVKLVLRKIVTTAPISIAAFHFVLYLVSAYIVDQSVFSFTNMFGFMNCVMGAIVTKRLTCYPQFSTYIFHNIYFYLLKTNVNSFSFLSQISVDVGDIILTCKIHPLNPVCYYSSRNECAWALHCCFLLVFLPSLLCTQYIVIFSNLPVISRYAGFVFNSDFLHVCVHYFYLLFVKLLLTQFFFKGTSKEKKSSLKSFYSREHLFSKYSFHFFLPAVVSHSLVFRSGHYAVNDRRYRLITDRVGLLSDIYTLGLTDLLLQAPTYPAAMLFENLRRLVIINVLLF